MTAPRPEAVRDERCSLCDESTGRAGRADDSLFRDVNGNEIGPLCSECNAALEQVGSFIESALTAARADERERAARVCDQEYAANWHASAMAAAKQAQRCAAAIRAMEGR